MDRHGCNHDHLPNLDGHEQFTCRHQTYNAKQGNALLLKKCIASIQIMPTIAQRVQNTQTMVDLEAWLENLATYQYEA